MNNINFKINNSTADDIKKHLEECSIHFAPALDTYVNIEEYANKIYNKAVRFEAFNDSKLIGLIAMYVDLNKKIASHDWLKISTHSQSEILPWKLFSLDIDNDYVANAVATDFQKHLICYQANELGFA